MKRNDRSKILRSQNGSTVAEVMAGCFLLVLLTAVFSNAFLSSGRLTVRSMELLREDAELYKDYYLEAEDMRKELVQTGDALVFVPEEGNGGKESGGFAVENIRLYRYTEDGKRGVIYDVETKTDE